MADEKKVDAGLEITVNGNVVDARFAFDDCEATIKLFMAFWTMLKEDAHAMRHFMQAVIIADKATAEKLEVKQPKDDKKVVN